MKIERDRLLNDVSLGEGLSKIINIFREGNEQENSILHQISICIEELNKMKKFDPSLEKKI